MISQLWDKKNQGAAGSPHEALAAAEMRTAIPATLGPDRTGSGKSSATIAGEERLGTADSTRTAAGNEAGLELPAHQSRAQPETKLRPIIGILGSKGGVGATTIAINVAAALAQKAGNKTTIFDANFQQPDAALMLAKEPINSILDLLTKESQLDDKIFNACRYEVKGGHSSLGVISGPLSGEAGLRTNLTRAAGCLQQMAMLSQSWVVDLPGHLDKHLVTMLDSCSVVAVVVESNLTSIAASKRWLEHLQDLGFDKSRVVVVINRAGGKFKHLEAEIAASCAGRELARIPNAFAIAEECAISGEPIVFRHARQPYTKAIVKLAESLQKSASNFIARQQVENGENWENWEN